MNGEIKRNCAYWAVGAVVGGILGAGIALLYAPQSGRETRKDIKRAVRNAKNSTADLIEDTIDDVSGFVNDLREKAAHMVDIGADLSDKARQDFVAKLDQVQKAIETKKQKLSGNLAE